MKHRMIDGPSCCCPALLWMIAFVLLAASVNVSVQSPSTANVVVRTIPAAQNTMIEVRVTGRGQPIILLSGTGADASSLDSFGRSLAAAGFQPVSVNPRGAGRSNGSLTALTLHDYAKDVAIVIESLRVGPLPILGWAGGNRVARCLATDRPELVRAVILVAAGGLVPGDPAAIAATRKWVDEAVSQPERLAAFRMSMLSAATNPVGIELPHVWPRAFAAQSAAEDRTPQTEWWTAGRAPLLVIQGLDDLIAPPGNGHNLRDQIGIRVKLVDIPKAGHALLLEHADRIRTEVITFLREVG
jgi:pimeloyl-ACP methyl ester carboxylesterase